MSKKPSLLWTKHLKDPAEIDRLIQTILGSVVIRNRLATILREELESLDKTECSVNDYDSPSWSHKQAHRNGQRASLQKVLNLIDL